jgi:hypothetical protein
VIVGFDRAVRAAAASGSERDEELRQQRHRVSL